MISLVLILFNLLESSSTRNQEQQANPDVTETPKDIDIAMKVFEDFFSIMTSVYDELKIKNEIPIERYNEFVRFFEKGIKQENHEELFAIFWKNSNCRSTFLILYHKYISEKHPDDLKTELINEKKDFIRKQFDLLKGENRFPENIELKSDDEF